MNKTAAKLCSFQCKRSWTSKYFVVFDAMLNVAIYVYIYIYIYITNIYSAYI